MSSEFDLIGLLAGRLGGGVAGPHGIGDDGAVLSRTRSDRVVVMDTMVEGVHFRLDWSGLDDVAFKLFNSNASDVFAMGGEPESWFLAMTLRDGGADVVASLATGFDAAVRALCPAGAPLLGGDTTAGPAFVLTVTMLGRLQAPALVRSAARAGQQLWLDGPVGLAAGGLALLQRGVPVPEPLLVAHRRGWSKPPAWHPDRGAATSAIDISDGLASDLMHVLRASGVAARLHLPLPGLDTLLAAGFGADDAIALQLDGGDDYVRLVAAERPPGPGWTRVGELLDADPALTVIHPDGSSAVWNPRGYLHFARAAALRPAGPLPSTRGTNG